MFEGNRICESSRAIQHLLEKYKQTDEDSTGRHVDYRTLIQPRGVVAKHATFPDPQKKTVRSANRQRAFDLQQDVIRLRLSGLSYWQVSNELGIPIGTCKTILHRYNHKQKEAK